MISSLSWIKKGSAQRVPLKCQVDDSKVQEMADKLKISFNSSPNDDDWEDTDGESSPSSASESEEDVDSFKTTELNNEIQQIDSTNVSADQYMQDEDDEELKKYNLEDYDDESDGIEAGMIIGNFKDMLYFQDTTAQDPNFDVDDGSEDEEEKADLLLSPNDNLIAVANTIEEVSYLEIYVYDEAEDNLYVHHDVMIPSFPLCTEWVDCASSTVSTSNFLAVGSLEPEIEIWNLDVLDTPLPEAILGLKKEEKHSSSVLGLSWNKSHKNMLLSGSADSNIKLWDIKSTSCIRTFASIHADKVQSVQWNPHETSVILSASFDKTACIFDARTVDEKNCISLNCDPECLRWNPHNSNEFLISDEKGFVTAYDKRSLAKPLFILQAHRKAATAIDWNPVIADTFVSVSMDKSAKLWTFDRAAMQPECIESKEFSIGKLFCGSFYSDSPYLFAVGGSRGELLLWNLNGNKDFHRKYTEAINKSTLN